MTRVLISVGSNMNDSRNQVLTAFSALNAGYEQAQMSRLYLTQPVGPVTQTSFVNAAIQFETDQSALEILDHLLELERHAGRDRATELAKGPRILDLDIILFGSEIWSEEVLTIPHPRFGQRRFVLQPAAEIVPKMLDPVTGKSMTQLLAECTDQSWITPLDKRVAV